MARATNPLTPVKGLQFKSRIQIDADLLANLKTAFSLSELRDAYAVAQGPDKQNVLRVALAYARKTATDAEPINGFRALGTVKPTPIDDEGNYNVDENNEPVDYTGYVVCVAADTPATDEETEEDAE